MARPLSPKVAAHKLYNLLGDDDLVDKISEAAKKAGDDFDARILVESALRESLETQENDTGPLNKEVLKICQNICKSLAELYIPY